MEAKELDLNKYTVDDLLKLFDIPDKLREYHIKKAKKTVISLHPDKNKFLPIEYYHFYRAAYNKLLALYQIGLKEQVDLFTPQDYIPMDNESLDKTTTTESFDNKEFNKYFETQVLTKKEITGHGDWLKSNDTFYNDIPSNKSDVETYLKVKRTEINGIVVYKGVTELNSFQIKTSNLDGTTDSNDSDIFGNFRYQDLKNAHTVNTILGIDNTDPHFKNYTERTISSYEFERSQLKL